jgi:hypothetical protein
MIVPVPYAAGRAIIKHFNLYALLYAWIYKGEVRVYFDLLSDRFFCSPIGWTVELPTGESIGADKILDKAGNEFDGEFTESSFFIIRFPGSVDLSGNVLIKVEYSISAGFVLCPLTEEEMCLYPPETDQMIRDIVDDEFLRLIKAHGVKLRRYFDISMWESKGITVWFYAADNIVTYEQLEEMYPGRFRPEDSEGLLLDRNLLPW